MPTNKNAMTRYWALDELLSDKYHDYSLDDLTDKVNERLSELYPDGDGVVRRTVEKDINYLEYEGPFKAEIERRYVEDYDEDRDKPRSKMCLRYKDPSFSIFKKSLSEDEKHLLRGAMTLIGQFDGLPELKGLEDLRANLGPEKDERKIISFTKNPLEGSNLLGELFTSISHRIVVELTHHTFTDKNIPLKTIVYPYLLKEYNRRWYLIAAVRSDEKVMNFPLDRIDSIRNLPTYEYKDYEGDINEFFEDIIGVTLYENEPTHTILFWVDDRSKDYVETKPLHDSQRILLPDRAAELHEHYPSLEGGKFFEIECKENYELLRELSSFGEDLIVLEPDAIRQKIIDRINKMRLAYSVN